MDNQTDLSNNLKDKINKIIATGVSNKDERTESLLHGEISTDGSVKKEISEDNNVSPKLPPWLQRFNIWHRSVMSDFVFLLWLTFIVGLLAGFGAHIFNRLISIVSGIFTSQINGDRINWWLIFIPVGGILLSGIYTRYIIRTNLTHSVSRLMHSIYKGNFFLKRNLIYSPILGGTITLGLGGSAGSEGPIAISGAAIGSNLGRWLQLKTPLVKVLVGCGAAAGISGIFQSPVGGLLFTLEFLKMEIGTFSILAVTLSSLTAYGVVFVCNGFIMPTTFMPTTGIEPSQYGAVLLMGILCGFYSLYYSQAINVTDNLFRKFKNPWLMNICGGLAVGVALLLFPALFGVGYPVMSDLIHARFAALAEGNVLNGIHVGSWGLIIMAVGILAIKCWACGACNASGGVSSDFAPTMFAGAIAGFLFSYFSNNFLNTELSIPAFTLLGMAAVMAGCIEAPMMTIFIVLNMGMNFGFSLAIIMVVYASYLVVRICSHIRGYDSKMVRHLQWFHHEDDTKPSLH
ncbi:MAG: chloride channel protein [Muribaculaceae bacterium]|nr:chloride channel protein [Muribaculaceae bacterium]